VSDRTRCAECNTAFTTRGPEDGKRLAIWATHPLRFGSSCALLCATCWTNFQERGPGPNTWSQSVADANNRGGR
jgi:hypothetical protein